MLNFSRQLVQCPQGSQNFVSINNKTRDVFFLFFVCLHRLNMPVKICSSWFVYRCIYLKHKSTLPTCNAQHIQFRMKTSIFTSTLNVNKSCYMYILKHCITHRKTVKVWLPMKIVLLKHCKHYHRKNNINQIRSMPL